MWRCRALEEHRAAAAAAQSEGKDAFAVATLGKRLFPLATLSFLSLYPPFTLTDTGAHTHVTMEMDGEGGAAWAQR